MKVSEQELTVLYLTLPTYLEDCDASVEGDLLRQAVGRVLKGFLDKRFPSRKVLTDALLADSTLQHAFSGGGIRRVLDNYFDEHAKTARGLPDLYNQRWPHSLRPDAISPMSDDDNETYQEAQEV